MKDGGHVEDVDLVLGDVVVPEVEIFAGLGKLAAACRVHATVEIRVVLWQITVNVEYESYPM